MRVLTGIQPSGRLHIGNYFGSIKKMVEAQDKEQTLIFVANYHALSSGNYGKRLQELTLQTAIDFLALGIDPDRSIFWVQSDIKEVLELYWILSSFTPMGILERAHSYKDKVAKGLAPNHALFSYPVLMAADILLFAPDIIPVGKDQIQHVEIARDIALRCNNAYGEIFKLPEYSVDEDVATVIGIDGQKMSKSYDNTIEIFGDAKQQLKKIKKIVTQNVALEAPKEWQNCNVYNIAKLFLNEDEQKELQARYERGGEGHGHFKLYLHEIIQDYFQPYREKREYYLAHKDEVYEILKEGANKAREIAAPTLQKLRAKSGIGY